jgi:hypothetical protein
MPQLIRNPVETQVVTKDGEVKMTIALEITLNLNTNGQTTVNVEATNVNKLSDESTPDPEKLNG